MRKFAAVLFVATLAAGVAMPAYAADLSTIQRAEGKADSTALTLRVRLPAVDEVVRALQLDGIVPKLGDGFVEFEQTVSLNSGTVLNNDKSNTHVANGFAAPLAGLLSKRVSSSCTSGECTNDMVDEFTVNLPAGLGTIHLLGARSATSDMFNTRNLSRVADVRLDLSPLLGVGKPLAVVGDLLRSITEIVNEQVVPVADDVVQEVKGILDGVLPPELEKYVEIGHVTPIPDLSSVELLTMRILDGFSNVTGGKHGLKAQSRSGIADLDVLGGFVKLDSALAETTASVNGKGRAIARANRDVAELIVGELLGIHLNVNALDYLTERALADALKDVPGGAAVAAELQRVLDTVVAIAGVSWEVASTTEWVSKNGKAARAEAGTLRILVEPKVPDVSSISTEGGLVPTFRKYIKTGIRVEIELPKTVSAVSVGTNAPPINPPPPRTGVGAVAPILPYGLLALAGVGAYRIRRRIT